jgi:hypothetical protein
MPDYDDYIQSNEWNVRRLLILKRDKRKCVACGSCIKLHVHHRTYIRFGFEDDADLVTLCEICHAFVHRAHQLANLPLCDVTDDVVKELRVIRKQVPVSVVHETISRAGAVDRRRRYSHKDHYRKSVSKWLRLHQQEVPDA